MCGDELLAGGSSLSDRSGEDVFELSPLDTLLTRLRRLGGVSPYVCASGFLPDESVEVEASLDPFELGI